MTDKIINTLIAGTLVTASFATFAVVSPMMEVSGFDLYEPPDRLVMRWYDYEDNYGIPTNTDTGIPSSFAEYPYRAILFGGMPHPTMPTTVPQGYMGFIICVYSKNPGIDKRLIDFEYVGTLAADRNETGRKFGNIRMHVNATQEQLEENGVMIRYVNTTGIHETDIYEAYGAYWLWQTLDFDFYYQCCGNLEIIGLRTIPHVPYDYILTCKDENGNGGGSTGGNQNPGGSSGGSSSGGSSSGDESSRPEWENSGSYDWETSDPETSGWDVSRPAYDVDWEGDTGEKGDTWTLPEWNVPAPPFNGNDITIPSLPVNPEYSRPDLPGKGNMQESYPDPVLPDGGWPPPLPTPNY